MGHKPSEERISAIQKYIAECFYTPYYSTQINHEPDVEFQVKSSNSYSKRKIGDAVDTGESALLKKIKKLLGVDSFSGEQKESETREEFPLERQMPAPKMPSRKLEDVVKEVEETFSQHLMRYIKEHGFKDAAVYKKANMDRKLFSKIKNDEKYRPSKTTALVLALALEMNLDETRDLLKRAGFALSHSNKQDIIVEYYINNGVYDLYEINEALLHFDEPLLWE